MAPNVSFDKHGVCNGHVEDFIRQRRLNNHKSNVQRARTKVNNTWSSREENRLMTSRHNVKREQTEVDKCADIKRENMRLLMQMQSLGEGRGATVIPQPPGRQTRCSSLPEVGTRGSNLGARMNELRRIDLENRRMLGRLRSARPSVNVAKLEMEHQHVQKVMQMHCEYGGYGNVSDSASSAPPRPKQPKDGVGVRLPPLPSGSVLAVGSLAGRGRLPEGRRSRASSAGPSTQHHKDTEPEGAAPTETGGCFSEKPADMECAAAETDEHACDVRLGITDADVIAMDERFGLLIPKASQALAESLLEADAAERVAEAEAASAKEAAARAFRDAEALDVGGETPHVDDEMLEYDRVVQRCNQVLDQRDPAAKAASEKAALIAAVRGCV
eukprot:TRINITY_DN50572_c0_g1_i1.p1 TRINITY_DN50572_c0_g1~~TRINITY_DN50572_c0_g1_i1.p1  ORF type:complete len:416 (+),score=58.20 TRINITY_DN50572_c0_g1_i1:91-1248(+)